MKKRLPELYLRWICNVIVETSLLIYVKLGFWMCDLSEAILFGAVLSKTTTRSAR